MLLKTSRWNPALSVPALSTPAGDEPSTTQAPAATTSRREAEASTTSVPTPTTKTSAPVGSSTTIPAGAEPTAPPTSTTAAAPSTTTAVQTAVYTSAGGSFTVRWTATAMQIVSTSPTTGYRAEVEGSGPEIHVVFTSSTRDIEITITLVGGSPLVKGLGNG